MSYRRRLDALDTTTRALRPNSAALHVAQLAARARLVARIQRDLGQPSAALEVDVDPPGLIERDTRARGCAWPGDWTTERRRSWAAALTADAPGWHAAVAAGDADAQDRWYVEHFHRHCSAQTCLAIRTAMRR